MVKIEENVCIDDLIIVWVSLHLQKVYIDHLPSLDLMVSFHNVKVWQMYMWLLTTLRSPKKESWFSSAPSFNFYQKREEKSHAPRQILSLGKHVKCMHFSSDMVFFNFQKRKEYLSPFSFFNFFLMRTKTFIFRGLNCF